LTILILFTWLNPAGGQTEQALTESEKSVGEEGPALDFGADLMSRYIWRGYDFGNSPAIQPSLSFSWKGLAIGTWGSYGFSKYTIPVNDTVDMDAGHYAEVDFYISYTLKWFTLMVYDYFQVNGLNPNAGNNFFNYKNAVTGHTLEVSLTFEGPEKFPIQLIAATLVYGADKDRDSTGQYGLGTRNNFSTYFEASYRFNIAKLGVELRPFIGGIPFGSSWYGPYGGIINLGLAAKKEIPITKAYALPVQVSVITNPQAQSIFLVFGISL